MGTHLIKVYLADGDTFITKINGTPEEIKEHYQQINRNIFSSVEISKGRQIKKIEYLESEVLRSAKTYRYLMIDWGNTGLLQ